MKKESQNNENLEKMKMTLLDIEHKNQFLNGKINNAERKINHLETVQVPLSLREKLEIFKSNKKKSIK